MVQHLAHGRAEPSDVSYALEEMAIAVLAAVPSAQYAGITRTGVDDHVVSQALTHPIVRTLDELQAVLRQGPCVAATRGPRIMRIPDMGADERWPDFTARPAELRVGSMLSLHLFIDEDTSAAVSLYARTPGAFSGDDETIAGVFAARATLTRRDAIHREDLHRTVAARDLPRQTRAPLTAAGSDPVGSRAASLPAPPSVRLWRGVGVQPCVVELSGEIDAATAPTLREQLLLLPTATDMVVDLSGVGFMGAAGLTLLLELRQRLIEAGATLCLTAVPTMIRRIISLVGLQGELPCGPADVAPGAPRRRSPHCARHPGYRAVATTLDECGCWPFGADGERRALATAAASPGARCARMTPPRSGPFRRVRRGPGRIAGGQHPA